MPQKYNSPQTKTSPTKTSTSDKRPKPQYETSRIFLDVSEVTKRRQTVQLSRYIE